MVGTRATFLPSLLFFYLFGSSFALDKCVKDKADFDECLEVALNKYLPDLEDSYVVESTRKGVTTTINKGPLRLELEYRNATIKGTNHGKLKLKYNSVTSTISGTIKVPKSTFIMPFKCSGTFGEVEYSGGGVGNCNLLDFVSSFIYEVKRYEEKGVLGLKMHPLYFSIDSIKKVNITYESISAPTEKHLEAMKLLSDQFGDLLIQLVKPEMEKIFKEHFAQVSLILVERLIGEGVYKLQ